MLFHTLIQLMNWSRSSRYGRLLAVLVLLLGWCVSQTNAQSDWRASADSAKAFLEAGHIQRAYDTGLRGAILPKPVREADSLWGALIQLSHRLPDSVTVVTLFRAGSYYYGQNEFGKADDYFTKTIEEGKRLRLPSHYLNGSLQKARTKLNLNARAEAAQLYTVVLQDSSNKPFPFYSIEALLGLMNTHIANYQFDSAATTGQQALARLRTQPNYAKTRYYPIAKMQLARCAYLQNDLTKAIEDIEESYSVAKINMSDDPALIAIGYSYTHIISDINDDKALEATQVARRALQRQPNYTRHPLYLALLGNEIGMLQTLERESQAVSLADSVLRNHSFDDLQQLPGCTALLSRINRIYINTSRKDALDWIASKAQRLLVTRKLTQTDSSYLYGILGRYHHYNRNYGQAIQALKEELRLDGASPGVSYFNHSLKNRLAICQAKAGQRTDSYASFQQLMEEFNENAQHNLWLMSTTERDNYMRTSSISGLFFSVLNRSNPNPDEIGLAYNYSLLGRGVRLKISRSINRFMLSQKATQTTILDQLSTIRALLTDRILDQSPAEKHRLQASADSLEQLMGREALAQIGANAAKPVKWQDIRAKLKPGEAAVELIWYNDYELNSSPDSLTNYYAALLLRPEWDAPRVVLLPTPDGDAQANVLAAEEKADMRTMNYYLRQVFSEINQKKLFDQVWHPISQALGTVKRIYIALGGSYQMVSLPTIYNHRTAKYLLDELDIVVLNSTQDILEAPLTPVSQTAELIGYPAYNLTKTPVKTKLTASVRSKVRTRDGLVFDELPFTKIEIEKLAKKLKAFQQKPSVRIDTAASESAFSQLKAPKLLHVATHGFYLDTRNRATSNNLMNCGLVLAGAADTTRATHQADGILTGYEASLLNLHGTELVTLSACETGMGDIFENEGVHGLQRAFLLAGAQSVLMSLWKVNDQLTQQLMLNFYTNWLSGMPKPQALRAAQMALRKEHPNPYYWGAFVLIGQ